MLEHPAGAASARDAATETRPTRPTAVPLSAVRAYDIRGVAGREITAAGVRRLGLAYAELARSRGLSRVGVGRDGRLSSPGLERALVSGLVAGGLEVHGIGLCPTPKLGFAVRHLDLDGALMVTASHNPAAENGLKLLLGRERVHGEALRTLAGAEGRPASRRGALRVRDVSAAYLDALEAAASGCRPLKVVWDCGNGATGPSVRELVRRIPGRHQVLNAEVDGSFPAHHPDPAVEENLAQLVAAVRETESDLGVAFDGDGDRIGVVDAAGRPLPADLLLLYLAQDLLSRRPGSLIIGDVKSSRLLFEGVRAAGGRALMCPSGYVLVREAMSERAAALAGELSGHVFFADEWDGTDDALYAAVRLLRALSIGPDLEAFRRGLPATYASREHRIPVARPEAAVAEIAAWEGLGAGAYDPRMGLRREAEDGWWLVRASGTERKLTCRCEAGTAAGLSRLREDLAARLKACGVEPPADLGA